jgi:hypothetical protein
MNRTRMKIQLILALLVSASYVTRAQNQLVLTRANGQTEAFNVSEIRSIKFANNALNLTKLNGSQSSWPLADISQYAFSNATSTSQPIQATAEQVKVFPNPVANQLSVEYGTSREGRIAIELLDLHGRVLRSIYNGLHQGKNTYSWSADLPGGMYVCRITSEHKIISKPFVMQ